MHSSFIVKDESSSGIIALSIFGRAMPELTVRKARGLLEILDNGAPWMLLSGGVEIDVFKRLQSVAIPRMTKMNELVTAFGHLCRGETSHTSKVQLHRLARIEN